MKKLIVLVFMVSCTAHASMFNGLVTSIHDGDTITVVNENGLDEKVRIAKVDTPELAGVRWGYQPYATEARNAMVKLCSKKIAVITPVSKDLYGRTVANVSCGGVNVATYLLDNGYAWAYRYTAPKAYKEKQLIAKNKKIGLWAVSSPIEPLLWRKNKMH